MKGRRKKLIKRIFVVALAPLLVWGGLQFRGGAATLLKRVSMMAVVMTMPEGGLMALENAANSNNEETQPAIKDETNSIAPKINQNSEDDSSKVEEPPQALPPDEASPNIPDKYKGLIVSQNMAGKAGNGIIAYGSGLIRNFTSMTPERVLEHLKGQNTVKIIDTTKPQVLIVHTHATESFTPDTGKYYDKRYNWRSTDNNSNMVAVGAVLAKEIEAAGIAVIHDTTQHDYPSYNGSYEKSEETVKAYLKKYPSIKMVFDLHRDAIELEDQQILKPVININGKNAAQMMIIACVDDGKIGIPNWEQNFKFAANLNSHINDVYPDLTRPIFLSYRKYNQHLSTGSLLFEFGSQASTLEEAKYSAQLIGKAIASFFKAK